MQNVCLCFRTGFFLINMIQSTRIWDWVRCVCGLGQRVKWSCISTNCRDTQLQIVTIHFPINAATTSKLSVCFVRGQNKTRKKLNKSCPPQNAALNAFYMFYCAFFRVFKTMQLFAEWTTHTHILAQWGFVWYFAPVAVWNPVLCAASRLSLLISDFHFKMLINLGS